mgnify:CR=1 FL=1
MAGPLSDVRIVDLTTVLLGPYATQTLGDMGASIIKIEAPEGDSTRYIGPTRSHGMGGIFLNLGRNKRSCVIDLKKPEAADVLARLIREADVLLYNMRPAAMARLGLSYEWAAAINPAIIYCGAIGFGEGGPYAGRPAFDDIIQAATGIASYQERLSGKPAYFATAVADKVCGLFVANAVTAALYSRAKTGVGQKVDVPMFETMAGFMLAEHLMGSAFEPPLGPPYYSRIVSPNRRPYQTQDGYIAVLPYNDRQWLRFFEAIGQPQLATDPRFATMAARTQNVDDLYAIIVDALKTKSSKEWPAILDNREIPNIAVQPPEDVLNDPHLHATGFFETIQHESEGAVRMMKPSPQFSETPADTRLLAPRLGQHTIEVLREVGFSAGEIDLLRSRNVVLDEHDLRPSSVASA